MQKVLLPLEGTVVHPNYSAATFLPYHGGKNSYYSVSRTNLLRTLMQQMTLYPHIKLYFGKSLVSINRQEKKIILQNTKTKKLSTVASNVVFGADGVHSRVRSFLQEGQETKHTQTYESWVYKEISISAKIVQKLQLESHSMHVWARKHALLLGFPNEDGSFTAMLILPGNTDYGFAAITTPAKIKTFITNNFPHLLPALAQIKKNILQNPEGKLVSIITSPWYYANFMTVLGDAAHGAIPFYGQGISAAFEDCLELVKYIDTYGTNWQKIFPLYQETRKKHADVLVTLSQKKFQHFLRYKQADYSAIYDRLESLLHKLFPEFWNPPLYIMMATHLDQFADILNKHNQQKKLAHMTGVSLMALILTGIVMIKEFFKNTITLLMNRNKYLTQQK